MSTLSTQVIDTSRGGPVDGLPVALERHDGELWRHLTGTSTDEEGRIEDLLPDGTPLTRGTYRLTYDTGTYFTANEQPAFYPVIRIVFEVQDDHEHHHIPLLLGPYGYSTCRTLG